jgi:hypothetical protein
VQWPDFNSYAYKTWYDSWIVERIFRHKWSAVSGATTAAHCLIIYGVVEYLARRGMWHPDSIPTPHSVVALGWVHVVGMLLAIGAAVAAIKLERPPIYGVTALLLGLFSYVIFVG